MIRFIDLSDDYWVEGGETVRKDRGRHPFAFLDTVTDQFYSFGGNSIWFNVVDFKEDFVESEGKPLDRFLSKIPSDVPGKRSYDL